MSTTESTAQAGSGTMLCACKNFTQQDMVGILSANPAMGFDDFLHSADVGQVCTACLLDLEHEYVHFDRSKAPAQSTGSGNMATSRSLSGTSWKQQFYRILDAISPSVPMPLAEVLPVISGHGFTQNLIVSNQSLLYEGKYAAPTIDLRISLRDHDGRVVRTESAAVECGQTFRKDISLAPQSASSDGFSVGSVVIERQAKHSGYRGTTRPQTELIGPGGATAVHSQSPRWNQGGEIVFDGRKGNRRFLSFVSIDAKPIRIDLRFPLPLYVPGDTGNANQSIVVPPNGTAFVEIGSADGIGVETQNQHLLCRTTWRGRGTYKVHAFNSDASLKALSIDHL